MKIFILRSEVVLKHAIQFAESNWEAMSKMKRPLVVDFHPESRKRSTQANRYYRAVLIQIQEQAWIEGNQFLAETWHEYFKGKYGKLMPLPCGGFYRTTIMPDNEFRDYVTRVEVDAQQELGVCLIDIAEPSGRTK